MGGRRHLVSARKRISPGRTVALSSLGELLQLPCVHVAHPFPALPGRRADPRVIDDLVVTQGLHVRPILVEVARSGGPARPSRLASARCFLSARGLQPLVETVPGGSGSQAARADRCASSWKAHRHRPGRRSPVRPPRPPDGRSDDEHDPLALHVHGRNTWSYAVIRYTPASTTSAPLMRRTQSVTPERSPHEAQVCTFWAAVPASTMTPQCPAAKAASRPIASR